MSQERFAQLHHAPKRMFAYAGGLQNGLVESATDDDRATFRRFEACLGALQRGASWDDAITIALNLEPKAGTASGARPRTRPSTMEPAIPAMDPNDEPAPIVPDPNLYAEISDEVASEGVEVSWDDEPAARKPDAAIAIRRT
jgi:hypothetical protein